MDVSVRNEDAAVRNVLYRYLVVILGLAAANAAVRGAPRAITLVLAASCGAVVVYRVVEVYSESGREEEAAAAAGGHPLEGITLVAHGNADGGAGRVVGADGGRAGAVGR